MRLCLVWSVGLVPVRASELPRRASASPRPVTSAGRPLRLLFVADRRHFVVAGRPDGRSVTDRSSCLYPGRHPPPPLDPLSWPVTSQSPSAPTILAGVRVQIREGVFSSNVRLLSPRRLLLIFFFVGMWGLKGCGARFTNQPTYLHSM